MLIRMLVSMLCLMQPRWNERQDKPEAATTREVTMANPVWVSTDGDWSAVGSWSTGAVPVSTDIVTFDGARSQVSVTSGLAQAAVVLAYLRIKANYTGDIGASGGHLVIQATKVTHLGSGDVYISPSEGSIGTAMLDSLSGSLFLNGITKNIHNLAGLVTVQASASGLVEFTQWGVQAETTFLSGSSAMVRSTIHAGTVNCAVPPSALLKVAGGVWNQTIWDQETTNVYVEGGTFKFIPTVLPTAPITKLVAASGLADFQDANFAVTVNTLIIGPNGDVIDSDIGTFGGTLIIDLRNPFP